MKLQHLAIVFILIVFPISLILSEYLNTQMKTINLQTKYTNSLTAATYDMMKSFQINTVNNRFSAISDSKIRDIQASINAFYTSLSSSTATLGLNRSEIETYTPAILCSLYDGYYIYSKYNNEVVNILTPGEDSSQYGLKPYIYYSCRYKKGTDTDFVVNYTLDNSITVYGKVNNEFVTKTGYLINTTNNVFQEVGMDEEVLSETILTTENGIDFQKAEYSYIIYGNDKIYYDPDGSGRPARTSQFFWYRENKKNYISDEETINYIRDNGLLRDNKLHSISAAQYLENAINFTNWVNQELGDIRESHAVTADGTTQLKLSTTIENEPIFKTSDNNDPLKEDSDFNAHRLAVIRNSIETNLDAAIANYNSYSDVNYEFGLPKFTEKDWDKILHNICFVSFMQGLPIGAKYYNNYVVITNDTNKEFVSEDAIYIIDGDGNYHQPGCQALLEGDLPASAYSHLQGYSNTNFVIQHLTVSDDDVHHFYLQDKEYPSGQKGTYACYECIVNAKYLYDLDDIIAGNIPSREGGPAIDNTIKNQVRKAYLTALARERYNLYKTNGYFGID